MVTVAKRLTPVVAEPPPARDRWAVPAAIVAMSFWRCRRRSRTSPPTISSSGTTRVSTTHFRSSCCGRRTGSWEVKTPSVFRAPHKLLAPYGFEVVDVRGSGYHPFPPGLGRPVLARGGERRKRNEPRVRRLRQQPADRVGEGRRGHRVALRSFVQGQLDQGQLDGPVFGRRLGRTPPVPLRRPSAAVVSPATA